MATRDDLDRTVKQLMALRTTFRAHSAFLVPDLALMGYLREAEENALAVLELVDSEVQHRAFPNARAIFESAQLALLLTTHADYRYAGALAWVYHLRKDQRLYDDIDALLGGQSGEEPPELQLAVDEIPQTWNDYSPGSGELVHRALKELDARLKAPDNWLGKNVATALERQIAVVTVERKLPIAIPKPGSPRAAYATLCRGTHPQTSIRPVAVRGQPGDVVTVEEEQRDFTAARDTILGFSAGATNFAIVALAIRLSLHPPT